MTQQVCPTCGEHADAGQAICLFCSPETLRKSDGDAKKKLDPKFFENECPACGARLDREKSFCPICSRMKDE